MSVGVYQTGHNHHALRVESLFASNVCLGSIADKNDLIADDSNIRHRRLDHSAVIDSASGDEQIDITSHRRVDAARERRQLGENEDRQALKAKSHNRPAAALYALCRIIVPCTGIYVGGLGVFE